MREVGSLIEPTIDNLKQTLEEAGLSLSGKPLQALKSVSNVLDGGLRGMLGAGYYYLSSVDPGIGKTLAVCSFLRAWKETGYRPASSVLIGLSRLEEINTYVDRSGLAQADFGVLTASEEHNRLGVDQSEHGSARVLFTTQQMILSRTRNRSFAEVREFHYQGRPRALRLWDETLLPAKPIAIRRDTLIGLADPLRPTHPEFVEALARFTKRLGPKDLGSVVSIPNELIDTVPRSWGHLIMRGALNGSQIDALECLSVAEGVELLVAGSEVHFLTLVGASVALPDDFSPAVVLDASGRVRETYKLWKEHRGNLIRLPEASNNYRKLHLHVWPTAAGKTEFNRRGGHDKFLNPIAGLINQDDRSRWLIVCYKATRGDFEAALKAMVSVDADSRVRVISWGQHHATNEHRDISNVVLIGNLTYRDVDYLAFLAAASGLPVDRVKELDVRSLKRGEYRHQWLQALCRASVRKSSNGVAGHCTAYVIARGSEQLIEDLRQTFPGAVLHEWNGRPESLSGDSHDVVEYVLNRFADETTQVITKAEIRVGLGIGSKQEFTRLMRDPLLRSYLEDVGLEVGYHRIRRVPLEFDTIGDDEGQSTLETVA